MHHRQMQLHELEVYERRKQKEKLQALIVRNWFDNMPNINNLESFEYNQPASISNRSRTADELRGIPTGDYVQAGRYIRFSPTFVVHEDNQDVLSLLTTSVPIQMVEARGMYIRNNFIHDTPRYQEMCNSYDYWSIISMDGSRVSFGIDPVRLRCLGCGVSGGINLSRGD